MSVLRSAALRAWSIVLATALTACSAADDPAAADWRLASPPQTGDTVLSLLVTEAECASGRSAEGRIVADVEYTETAIRVSVAVRPLGGGQDCQGNPETPYALRLDEPVGDRPIEPMPTG